MLRGGLAIAVAAIAEVSLTGCSAVVSSISSSEQLQALKFESDPPGAEIHTAQGRTCNTPCELTVQTAEQLVIITKNDYQPQTVQVTLGPQPDHSFWENPPPTLAPNPVHVVLHPVSKPVHHVGGRKTHTAKAEPAPSAASSPFPPPPPAQEPAASTVWPPPPKQ